jgi:hypothetical protein
MSDLSLLPADLVAKSISEDEIVLPLTEALQAIDHLEANGQLILGWEGWIKTADGRVGHGNAPQGTVSLADRTVKKAAQLCRETILEDKATWSNEHAGLTDELYFCITVST